jgi:tetratricopeptide (TPR) repeat protein
LRGQVPLETPGRGRARAYRRDLNERGDSRMSLGPRERILKITEAAERTPITLGRWLLVLGAIVVLRHFLEQLSGQQKTLYFLSYFLHYPLAYVAPMLALSVVLAGFARERIERVTRLMLFAWLLTLLPPLIDILMARASDGPELIGYLIPQSGTLAGAFVNLFNPAYQQFQGATSGIRIEAAVGCLLGAYYVHLKTRSLWRSVAAFAGIYVTMFFFFTLPVVTVAVTRLFGGDVGNVYQLFFARASVHRAFTNATPFALSDLSNSLVDLLVIAPVLVVWYRMYDRKRFARAARLVNPVSAPFHVVTTFAGMALGARLLMKSEGLLSIAHPFDVISIIGLLAAAFFTSLTASALREIHREDGPPEGADREEMIKLGAFFFSFASLFALSVSYVSLTYVLAAMGAYYFYYARPLRFERFAVLSGFTIGAVTLFSVTLGFAAYAGASGSLWFPRSLVVVCLVVPTLGLLSREMWERTPKEADRWSLRGLAGEGGARAVAAAAVFVAAMVPAAVLRTQALFVTGAIVGLVGAFAVVRVRSAKLPVVLGALTLAYLVAGAPAGLLDAPVLATDVSATDFARVSRRSGEFEMFDREAVSEDDRLLAEGVDRFRRGDYEAAVESFREVLEKDPENTRAYLSIGSAYLRMNRLAEAARSFRRVLTVQPDNATAHVGLGQVSKLGGDSDAAIEELTRALELDPESTDAHYTLALIYQELNELELEVEHLTATVTLDPRASLAHSRLADIYLVNERYPEAISALKAALLGRTTVEHAHTRLAEAYYGVGDLEASENELRKEIALRPRSAAPHANLAKLLIELNRIDEARHEYETALSLTSDERLRELLESELSALTD